MSKDRFQRIKELVLKSSDLTLEDRSAYLDRECGSDQELRAEVEAFLVHNEVTPRAMKESFLGPQLAKAGNHVLASSGENGHPEKIGPYEIREVLGQGGMGIVYRARQTHPIQREVALKLVRQGIDSQQFRARFEIERQTLARMDHPGIARILDAGSDPGGRPYYVMELVEGEPVTEYCRQRSLPLSKRLQLVVDIARAVHSAHQKGVIHRDLKPSNIMVGNHEGLPAPHIIDFGVAKVVAAVGQEHLDLTREGQPVGTVRYMSPEQARGHSQNLDVRSDVYSLGTILFEIITGKSPLPDTEDSLLTQLKAVCEELPPPFREALPPGQQVDDDVEIIVRKCLAKEPQHRYQSAEALADDLERFLNKQPIAARPLSTIYQIRKLVQRNKLPAALTMTLAIMGIGFTLWMATLYAISEKNYQHALQAEGEAKGVSDFMIDIFNISDPGESRGNSVTAREILDRGASRIETDLVDQPEIQARLMHNMGLVYRGLGIYDESRRLLEFAMDRHNSSVLGAAPDELLADIFNDFAAVERLEGRLDSAVEYYQKSLAIKVGLFPDNDPKIAAALNNLGLIKLEQGNFAEADSLLEMAQKVFTKTSPESQEMATNLTNLALVRYELGRYAEAEEYYRLALALREAIHEPNHPDVADAHNNLSAFLSMRGRHAEALPSARRALAIWEKTLGPDQPDLAAALMNLAGLHRALGDLVAAEPLYLRALAIQERALGTDNYNFTIMLNNLGHFYRDLGRLEECEVQYRRSLAIRRKILGYGHPKNAAPLNSLGQIFILQGRLAEADSLLVQALDLRIEIYGTNHTRTALPMHNLGVLRLRQGRLTESRELLLPALQIRQEKMASPHRRIAESLEACAELSHAMGRETEAEAFGNQAEILRLELASPPSLAD